MLYLALSNIGKSLRKTNCFDLLTHRKVQDAAVRFREVQGVRGKNSFGVLSNRGKEYIINYHRSLFSIKINIKSSLTFIRISKNADTLYDIKLTLYVSRSREYYTKKAGIFCSELSDHQD